MLDWPHTLIATPFMERIELYSLDSDPGELSNPATVRPEVANRLLAELETWWGGEIRLGRPDLKNMKQIEALGYIE